MTGGLGRRALLGIGTGLLAGCGFHPLYLPAEGGGAVDPALASIYVPVIGERTGQLLRQALQQRLEGTGSGVQKRYDLIAAPAIAAEQLGIQRDSSATRFRFNATANWTLRKLDLAHTTVTSGSSRITDGLNVVDGQYFAVDLEIETVNKRICEALADQIVQQLATYLRRQPAPA